LTISSSIIEFSMNVRTIRKIDKETYITNS